MSSFLSAQSHVVRYKGEFMEARNQAKSELEVAKAIEATDHLGAYLLEKSSEKIDVSKGFSVLQKVTLSFSSYDLQVFRNEKGNLTLMGCKSGEFSKDELVNKIMSVDGGGENFWTAIFDAQKKKITYFAVNDPW